MKRRNVLKVSPFEFKFAFQNVDRIWVWVLKQSCRTLDFEQLLFLEIFELLHEFGSNLGFNTKGNFINTMNSARGRHLIAGVLRMRSGRCRGRPWLRAGAGKTPSWLPLDSWPSFKGRDAIAVVLFSSSVFQSPLSLLR